MCVDYIYDFRSAPVERRLKDLFTLPVILSVQVIFLARRRWTRRWRRAGPWRWSGPWWCNGADSEEDWVVVGKRSTKGDAISREGSIETTINRFHLHIVSEHPLSGITVVSSGRQESQQRLMAESNTLIAALCQMG